ncbi:MAG: DUF4279 domain-containing protein [Proteobacteria bacterium]|nr:DUF4279 domain-containing protein [Pseudomonadota bacterium]MBS0269177.1 DUF4279 domain-containing protein [Pseudomonadota bacterium]
MAALSETAASLRIFGQDLDPDEITNLLGKAPDVAERRGQVIRNLKSGTERTARRGRWGIHVERRSPGDLDAQIAALLDGTTEDLAVWQRVTSAYDADIFCGLFLEEKKEGLCVGPATLKKLGDRGLRLDLDIYAP